MKAREERRVNVLGLWVWDWSKREKRDGVAAVGSAAALEMERKVKGKENVGRRREGLKAKGRICGGCQKRRGESL